MRTIARKKNGVMITDQTPSCRDFEKKANKLLREVRVYAENNKILLDKYTERG